MPDKAKRKPPYSYRPPEDRRAAFERRVAESGLSVNAFITEAIFGRNRHRPAEMRLLSRLLGECAAIADLVRRIETSEGENRHEPLLESVKSLLIEIRSALFLLMGRKP